MAEAKERKAQVVIKFKHNMNRFLLARKPQIKWEKLLLSQFKALVLFNEILFLNIN